MSRSLQVRFSLQGAIREDKDTASFVSYCPALDLYSAGRTRPEAKRALQSAVDLFVRSCYSRGILGQVLQAKGFEATDPNVPDEHGLVDGENFIVVRELAHREAFDDVFNVEVPLHLIAAQAKRTDQPCLQ